jgi:hypothetical protein
MALAIYADEQTLHKAHIRLKCERGKTFTPATTTDAVQSDQTLEIGNLRWFGKILQGHCSRQNREMVDEDAQR